MSLLLIAVCVPASAADEITGEMLYGEATPVDRLSEPALARISFEMERCGSIFRTTWRDSASSLLAADELEGMEDVLERYRYVRPNVNEWARVRREADSVRIEHFDDGRRRTALLPASKRILVGPMIALAAGRELAQLRAGERFEFRYAVPDRLAAYDFALAAAGSPQDSAREVQVTAVSWIVRKFVNPVSLYFNEGGQFAGMRGRALPAIGGPGRRQPLELEARVLRREPHRCSPSPRNDDWFERAAVRN